ncbi:General stress protein A [bioreactor metagenome]|uniref:General stress protein A n=1 Tax=bioreactor metagenome TaxID=1076179 RepID=A0A644YAN7_9ZZZZ
MNILVTVNSNYILPLMVMLKSLFMSNPGEYFDIYLLYTNVTEGEIRDLEQYIKGSGHSFYGIEIQDEFSGAPVIFHYTKEMYYRLLAYEFLPGTLDRILYLDPDILVLNPIKALYDMDMEHYLFAAAYHNIPAVKEVNRLRLTPYDIEEYYNSGVLLMNLELQRQHMSEKVIFDFIDKNELKLIMPDQDILNALYAKEIKPLDEKLYNYDARYFYYYKVSSNGLCDMDFVIRNTVFLHFCGKRKPWTRQYNGKFDALYKHYQKTALG